MEVAPGRNHPFVCGVRHPPTTATATIAAAATTLFPFRFFLKELFFQSFPFQSFPIVYRIFLLPFVYSDRFISPGLVVRTLRLAFL
ncbi:MAG: hypothetical protein EZS28_051036 [Streblomastix strix]|uniref:Uncharacterized protein n=1 Tax=Streblomastix strix TaxID=222440 RepID=A0A5J4T4V7_9EUKA|nr:MAG: hypothetical protein EZS28_051036 [Streblomastix strix]